MGRGARGDAQLRPRGIIPLTGQPTDLEQDGRFFFGEVPLVREEGGLHRHDVVGGDDHLGAAALKGTTVAVCLYVEDADAAFQRAVAAGATVSMPLADQFWGDRFGNLTDPYGHEWEVVTHLKDLTPDEMAKGAQEFFSKIPK